MMMAKELRKTGISVVGDVSWGTHFCSFYETKRDLIDILIPYFKTGLENNEFCLWIISNSELLSVQEARNALQKALPDLDRYVAERSIEVVGHDEWFLSGGTFDFHRVAHRFKEKLDEVLPRGYAGMRINGSPAWIQTGDARELRAFEQEVDQLFPTERIIASCTYPLEDSGAGFLLDVAQNHQFAIARRQGNWEVLETPELVQAKHEIKRLNQNLEQRVIERTRQLAATNEELRRENAERKRAEEALRRSEERIRMIIDAVPTMAWSLRPDGVLDFVNQRWSDYTGLSFEEEIEDPGRVIYPDDRPRVMENWRAHMAARTPYDDEMRLRRTDGEYRWFLVRTAPLRDEQGNLIKWYGVSTDIDDRKRAEEQLKAITEQLRALSGRLQKAKEEESTRIARELHDELGSSLTALKWTFEEIDAILSTTSGKIDVPLLREKLRGMTALIDNTVTTVRRISSELRPSILDDLGLVAALEWEAKKFQARTGIATDCDCAVEKVDLDNEQSIAVFRILQETLTNILRHAQATRVDIKIKQEDGHFVLTVSDNGRGITEAEKSDLESLGLLGMKERAHMAGGDIDVRRSEIGGTSVTLRIPT